MTGHYLEHLAMAVEGTADWRQRKAAEFAGDGRNAEAAALLLKLSVGLRSLPRGDEAALNYEAAMRRIMDEHELGISEEESEELRSVGFRSDPTPHELLNALTAIALDRALSANKAG